MTTKTAHHVRDLTEDGSVALYRMSPPMLNERFDHETGEYIETRDEYVVASAVTVFWSGPETYLFSADEDGEVTDWVELAGSFRGALDHAKALAGAGYVIAEGNR
jgi:hypothetical protein